MSMTAPRPLLGVFRTDFVLFTIGAVTLAVTGHPTLVRTIEPMTGRGS